MAKRKIGKKQNQRKKGIEIIEIVFVASNLKQPEAHLVYYK